MRRLALICHAATAATRSAAFPHDEPVDDKALQSGLTIPAGLQSATQCWTSPALRALQTIEALALRAAVEPMLRDCDFGRWAGRALGDVKQSEPDAMAQWLSDPAAAPHGGESIVDLMARAAAWLASLTARSGQIVAVTHPSVIRAAVVNALGAPATAFWRIDVPPLAIVELKGQGSRWTLALRSTQ